LYSNRKNSQVQLTPHLPKMRRFAFASRFDHLRMRAASDFASRSNICRVVTAA
jgi:hypothetical protein